MIDVVFAAATYLPPDTLRTIFEADSLPVLGGSLSVSIPGSFLASAEVSGFERRPRLTLVVRVGRIKSNLLKHAVSLPS